MQASTDETSETTRLLLSWCAGDAEALDQVIPRIYDELQRMAAGYLRFERSDHTLSTAGLVHEAFLRLIAQEQVTWQNRAHFMGVAAKMMRRVLVDHARRQAYAKRGGAQPHLILDEAVMLAGNRPVEATRLNDALEDLARLDAQQAEIVEMRFYGGMTAEEIGEALQISVATVTRKWRHARAWLYRYLAVESSS